MQPKYSMCRFVVPLFVFGGSGKVRSMQLYNLQQADQNKVL